MSRKAAREIALHMIFEMGFTGEDGLELLKSRLKPENFTSLGEEDHLYTQFPPDAQLSYIKEIVQGVSQHMLELDSYIEKYAVGWKFGRISRMAASIMRLSMYEILYMTDIPNSASINEAVEFAKSYDSAESAAFINGILGSFVRKEVTV